MPYGQYTLKTAVSLVFATAFFGCVSAGYAADATRQHAQACLEKAGDLPDMAAAEADYWFNHNGGDAARLCRATAQFNRGEFEKSGRDFAILAASQKDAGRGALLHAQAALGFMRAGNFKLSDEEYGRAIKLENDDPDLWTQRATERASAQRYWEALADANEALGIMPDMPEALRLRGQIWYKLGLGTNAKDDFGHAASIEQEDDAPAAKPAAPRKQ